MACPLTHPELSLRDGGMAGQEGKSSGQGQQLRPLKETACTTTYHDIDRGGSGGLPLLSGLRVVRDLGKWSISGLLMMFQTVCSRKGVCVGLQTGTDCCAFQGMCRTFESSITCSQLQRSWEAFLSLVFKLKSRQRRSIYLQGVSLQWAASLSLPQGPPPSYFLDRVVIGEAWC